MGLRFLMRSEVGFVHETRQRLFMTVRRANRRVCPPREAALATGREQSLSCALRVAESTKSMNCALCSIRRDCGVAKLMTDCLLTEPVERGLVSRMPGGVDGRGLRGDRLTAQVTGGHRHHDRGVGDAVVDQLHLPMSLWV